ncbi:potassium channel family protein [Clostridium sp. Marseille-P2415]|uniref:potassium channel family protein n=1 Tax=Clostridium sp. Marseille-P2415 TaxID=1805471 RepID=UPI00098870A7|nr:TrkA family potassium uptake protein [Clostridium sp. Marseille-P2415]
MKLLTDRQEKGNYTIIIGCGRLGANLANTLSDGGEDVLIIDKNKEAFRKLSPSFGGLSIIGDATDFDVLQEAQISDASAVIAVTNNDNANIMVAQIAREMFHIERVIARLYDPDREYVYREFGIDTICPAILSVKEIDKILSKTGISNDMVQEEKQ